MPLRMYLSVVHQSRSQYALSFKFIWPPIAAQLLEEATTALREI